MQKKSKFVPLHDQIASAQGFQESSKKDHDKRVSEVKSLYQEVFDTPQGQNLKRHLIDMYLTTIPNAGMSPTDVMFMAGQESVVKTIVKLSQRGE